MSHQYSPFTPSAKSCEDYTSHLNYHSYSRHHYCPHHHHSLALVFIVLLVTSVVVTVSLIPTPPLTLFLSPLNPPLSSSLRLCTAYGTASISRYSLNLLMQIVSVISIQIPLSHQSRIPKEI
ncbi:hypothetical protein K469DRAFT_719697 [Zopfia rhizophila CBS 207.26]|uniref:Uncharacterized protein n=1 Tax=Zopfia rhizophila CBS 207.26 TaxID=1314779 RepID=A0A6A6DDM7_9PEZI|nr:hypothetical protein K469DRAFT_719697 [Zopfia rhizophila CBS 207.26]